ncbi:hypothetical protein HAX54_002608, partial [Datura stramonium]|nr:hypothetical protein [Datura stramonium]
ASALQGAGKRQVCLRLRGAVDARGRKHSSTSDDRLILVGHGMGGLAMEKFPKIVYNV